MGTPACTFKQLWDNVSRNGFTRSLNLVKGNAVCTTPPGSRGLCIKRVEFRNISSNISRTTVVINLPLSSWGPAGFVPGSSGQWPVLSRKAPVLLWPAQHAPVAAPPLLPPAPPSPVLCLLPPAECEAQWWNRDQQEDKVLLPSVPDNIHLSLFRTPALCQAECEIER